MSEQEAVWVSRPSPWGNPHKRGEVCGRCGEKHVERGNTLPCYEDWLAERLMRDPDFLEPLRGKKLMCRGCEPDEEDCHIGVIRRWL